MQHSHFIPEICRQQSQQLRGQCNFRHQQHGAFSAFQTGGNEFDIYRRLTGPGYAIQQCNSGIVRGHLTAEFLKAALLLGIERQRTGQPDRSDFPAAEYRLFRQLQIAQLFQPVYGSRGCTGEITQFFHRHTAKRTHQFQDLLLHGRRLGAAGSKFHSFLSGSSQHGNSFGLIIGFPLEICLGGYPFLPQQVRQNIVKHFFLRYQIPKGSFLRLSA